MSINAVAAIAWGLAYTVSVLLIGLGLNRPIAWQFALMTMAFAFFSHVAQITPIGRRVWLVVGFTLASWATATVAGAALFF